MMERKGCLRAVTAALCWAIVAGSAAATGGEDPCARYADEMKRARTYVMEFEITPGAYRHPDFASSKDVREGVAWRESPCIHAPHPKAQAALAAAVADLGGWGEGAPTFCSEPVVGRTGVFVIVTGSAPLQANEISVGGWWADWPVPRDWPAFGPVWGGYGFAPPNDKPPNWASVSSLIIGNYQAKVGFTHLRFQFASLGGVSCRGWRENSPGLSQELATQCLLSSVGAVGLAQRPELFYSIFNPSITRSTELDRCLWIAGRSSLAR